MLGMFLIFFQSIILYALSVDEKKTFFKVRACFIFMFRKLQDGSQVNAKYQVGEVHEPDGSGMIKKEVLVLFFVFIKMFYFRPVKRPDDGSLRKTRSSVKWFELQS